MGRRCSVCDHADVEDIDAALVARKESLRSIADRHGLERVSLGRHRDNHVSPALQAVVVEQRDSHARTLAEHIERLVTEAERLLDRAKEGGSVSQMATALRELRASVEQLGKYTGELRDGPQVQVAVNLQTSTEWREVRSVILRALEGHPEARAEVTAALLVLPGGSS